MSVGCVAADPTLPVPLALAPLKLGDAIYNNQSTGITNSSSTTEIEQIENGEGDSLTAHWRLTPIRRLETWQVASRGGQCSASDQGRADRCLPAWRRRAGACLLPADGEQGSQGGSRMGARRRRGRAGKRKGILRRLLVAGGRRAAGRGSRRVASRGGGVIRRGWGAREGGGSGVADAARFCRA